MADIKKDLKERFDFAAYFFMSAWEHDPETKIVGNSITRGKDKEDAEGQMIDTFEKLRDSADSIPSLIVAKAEELRMAVGAEKYETLVIEAIQNVGFRPLPGDAAEFLETLNSSLQNSVKEVSS